MNLHVKVRGPYFIGDELIYPGSVVPMDEDAARQFIRRGLGELHPGPAMRAPAPDHPHGTRADGTPIRHWSHPEPERADLGNKLARAEQQVGRPQAAAR